MRLINKEDVGQGGKVSFAGESIVRLVLRLFQCFEYAYVVYILVFFILFCLFSFMSYWTEAYSEPYRKSKMKLFAKIVNDWDAWQCSE